MKITVILCTYNRCQSLATALESVGCSVLPESTAWEVLVVDNNSGDQTREVTQDFCRRFPGRFRYLFEPSPGKSNALNSGIREAMGEILAFMDDDVVVEPTWLQGLVGALENKEWTGVGGRILPQRNFSPPSWMPMEGGYSVPGILALFDRGPESRELNEAVFGTNMAFRKAIFEKYGGFRTDLGPNPLNEIRAEDTEFCQRLMRAGERLGYQPSAVVYHAIPENRLTRKYLLAWWFADGRAGIRQKEKRAAVWGIPRDYISILNRILRLLPPRVWHWITTTDSRKRFACKCGVWMMAGEIFEVYLRCSKPEDQGIPQSQVVKQ